MRKVLATLLIFLTALPSFALLEEKKITLKEAIDVALKINPQMKMIKIDVEKSKNDIKTANRLQNPSLGTGQNIGKTARGNAEQVSADLVIEILKRGKRKNVAKSESIAMENNQKYQEVCFAASIKLAYINYLLKKANLKILNDQMQISKEIYDYANKASSKGNTLKTEAIQAKIAYNRSFLYKNIASSEMITAQNEFNAIMNSNDYDYNTKEDDLTNNYEELMTLNPEDNFLTFEKVKTFALQNRFDLKKALQDIETAQNKLKVVRSQLIPDLEVTGGYQYQTKGMSDSGKYTNGAYAAVDIVNIPVLYRFRPEIQNAKLDIEKAQIAYEDTKVDAIRNITDAWEKYTIAKDTLVFYNKELLVNSKELMRESLKSLEKKEIDLTSFLVSKKLYLELSLGYEEALSDYYVSYAQLLKEMNIIELNKNDLI